MRFIVLHSAVIAAAIAAAVVQAAAADVPALAQSAVALAGADLGNETMQRFTRELTHTQGEASGGEHLADTTPAAH